MPTIRPDPYPHGTIGQFRHLHLLQKPSYSAYRSVSLLNGETNLRRQCVGLIALLLSFVVVANAGPKLELSWKNPNYDGAKFKNILVLALNGKAANRAEFEDELVAAITRPAAPASPSYEFIARPDATQIDKKDLRELIREQKFDAIVVARLTKRETKTTYVEGQAWTPYPYYGTFYGFYDEIAPVIYTPGYLETEKTAQVELNFYSTAKPDGELVWTGTTNTFDVSSAMKSIKGLVKIYAKALEQESIIDHPAK